jgi:hypothetical protein
VSGGHGWGIESTLSTTTTQCPAPEFVTWPAFSASPSPLFWSLHWLMLSLVTTAEEIVSVEPIKAPVEATSGDIEVMAGEWTGSPEVAHVRSGFLCLRPWLHHSLRDAS